MPNHTAPPSPTPDRAARSSGALVVTALLVAASGCVGEAPAALAAGTSAQIPSRDDYADVSRTLSTMILHEMEKKGIPALSIALVEDDEVVWAEGFGMQDPDAGVPASAETVYRVGSVSKLFTDIAVVQLVERGELDLDTPIQAYLPDFAPTNNSGVDITLRQLMSHRSGLVREPPAGHYFDDTGTSLAATVESLNATALVYAPESHTKYSNAAIATVGYTLEVTQGEPFADYVRRAVLNPLGMDGSAFTPEPNIVEDLATAYMWAFDRPPFLAPTFELGMAPAGSMYSTVLDLSLFISAMFNRGRGVNGRLLEPATLEMMWRPQYAEDGATTGFGLGFAVDEMDGRRRLGHGGAIYGFSTQLAFLPDDGIGVVVISTLDGTNTTTGRIAESALQMMLATKEDRPLPAPSTDTRDLSKEAALSLEGVFGQGSRAIDLDERNGALFMTPARGGPTVEIRSAAGDTLIVDDRLAYGARFVPEGDGLRRVGGGLLVRNPDAGVPGAPPQRWRGLIGEYGWDHNVLYILEREGQLFALIEWFFPYPLAEISRDVYAFPDWGLYQGERLIFTRNANDRATEVKAAGVDFVRREVGTEVGGTFRITPQRPVADLRAEALAASPPQESGDFRESDLVEVTSIEPGIELDVRYASTNNFMSTIFYDEPRVFLQRPAAEGVARAHRALAEYGFGLLLHDGYRPWYVTKMFWDATPLAEKIFVANPANGSRHNRGSAIDLTLYDLETGLPVDMVGTYDEMSPRSFPDYPGGTSRQRWLRELLRRTMESEGFTVYSAEWWHFDHDDWREYAIQNVVFGEIEGRFDR
jgi:CubicO group peptidase (beta-lactamase class C family)/D-alanyl-D-alanine dipeptidase